MKTSVLCWKAGSKTELASIVRAFRRGQPAQSSGLSDNVRIGLAYRDSADLRGKLERAEGMLASGAWNDHDGLFCRTITAPPSIAFLYPGQGSQAVNMLSGLRAALPEFEGHLQRLDGMQRLLSDLPLLPLIYTARSREADARLRDTRHAQPALGLVETAARLSLESLGVRARFHAGHSYGELPALCGAGFLDERLLMTLSLERGRLLDLAGQSSPGGMAAVAASYEDVRALCERTDTRLEIANINAASQVVVSGPLESIALLEDAAARGGISARRLATSCAFHSSLVAPVLPRWRQFLAGTLRSAGLPPPNARAFSSVTAAPYDAPDQVPELLGSQLVEPVRWADICTALLREGVNIFIEVGPGRTLTDLMIRNGGPGPLSLAMDPLDTDGDRHLGELLAQLAAAGVDLRGPQAADHPLLPQDAGVAASANGFFDANRDVMERYFAQQAHLVELALRNAAPEDRIALTQRALESNQKIVSEFLTAQETVASWLLKGHAVDLPVAAYPQAAQTNGPVARPRLPDSTDNTIPRVGDLSTRIAAALRAAISDTTGFPPESINERDTFSHLGIDSLTMAEIWAEVANRIPEVAPFADRMHEIRTIGDVASLSVSPASPREEVSAVVSEANPPACAAPAGEPLSPSNWGAVRAQLVEAIRAVTGVADSRILASADFERDLGLDVFRLEAILVKHLFNHPLFGQAGRALLNARSLSDLDTLLERFDLPIVEEPEDEDTVQRYVPREEPLAFAGHAEKCPRAVLLVANASAGSTDFVRSLLTGRGSSVTFREAAGDVFHDSQAADARHVLFLARDDAAATNLFALAKSLWGQDGHSEGASRLAILGSHADGPEARGAIGVARSLRRELPHVAIRTVWLRSRIADADEDSLMAALFSDQVEGDVALAGRRLTRETLEATHGTRARTMAAPAGLGSDSRILVLGGGDGISAEIAIGLARTYRCEILALGRTPWPESLPYPDIPDGPDAPLLLKRAILNDPAADGLRADVLQQRWKLVSRQRALWSTNTRIAAAGGRFRYEVADVSDAAACAHAIRRVQSAGPVHGIVHGAGIVCDNLLPRKTVREFQSVVDTKVVPARVLQELLAGEPLQFVLFLSSMTSYTGTAGQTDYAAANEILNAVARTWNSRAAYPVKSLLWSVWTETGLASAVLKRHMTTLGLGGIRTAEGVDLLLNELTHGQKAEDWLLFAPGSTLRYAMASTVPRFRDAGRPASPLGTGTLAPGETVPLRVGQGVTQV